MSFVHRQWVNIALALNRNSQQAVGEYREKLIQSTERPM